jgi:hypothetical protein
LPVFAPLFSGRVWRHAQVLLIGALLAPGQRTDVLESLEEHGQKHLQRTEQP